jgi:hypothetical protein
MELPRGNRPIRLLTNTIKILEIRIYVLSCYSVNATLATTFCSSLGWAVFGRPCWNYKHVTCQLRPLYFHAKQLPIAVISYVTSCIQKSSNVHQVFMNHLHRWIPYILFPSLFHCISFLYCFSWNCEKRPFLRRVCPPVRLSTCLSTRIQHLGSHWTDNIRKTRSYFQIIQSLPEEQHCCTCSRRALYTTKIIGIHSFVLCYVIFLSRNNNTRVPLRITSIYYENNVWLLRISN